MPDNLMDSWSTLTGISLTEATHIMQEMLPPQAYKAVPGATDFTDIDPSYLTEVATRVFGPAGIGWWYNYTDEDVTLTGTTQTTSKGRERYVYSALIKRFELSYAYVVGGKVVASSPILSQGASENENDVYALRGALTNALGAAFAKLCWQLPVYKGLLTHRNAADLWAKKKSKNGSPVAEAVALSNMAAAASVAVKATPKPDNRPATPSTPVEQEPTNSASVKDLAWAKTVKIPAGHGIPFEGKELGMALANQNLGWLAIRFLGQEYINKDGVKFAPITEADTRAMEASKIILNEVEGVRQT